MVTSRPTRYTGVETFGPSHVHGYEMTVPGAAVSPALRAAARPLVEEFARELPGAPGFVIYHRARPAHFVLAHLWDRFDLMQRYWTSPLDDPAALTAHRAGAIGCVWELKVVARERDAWARALADSAAVDAYLSSGRGHWAGAHPVDRV